MNEIDVRAQYLAGVRELIAWLEQNPAQPLPVSREFNVPVSTNSAVEKWAADNDMSDAVQYDKEGNASISLRFGPVKLHVYGYVNFAEHCDRNNGRSAREYAEKHGLVLVDAASTDNATEAFVDAADAERYAMRDEYVNGAEVERTTLIEQAARDAEPAPACARCKIPFDPEDKSYTGSAQHDDTPFCKGCIDNCHEAGADHRCVICAPRNAESEAV